MMKKEEIISTLKERLQNLMKEEKLNELVKILNSPQMRTMMESFLSKTSKDKFSEDELPLLEVILESCNAIYNYDGSDTGLSDSEYDALVSLYNSMANKPLGITESSGKNKESHRYTSLRGSLDKIYKVTKDDVLKNKSQDSLDDWVKRTQAKLDDMGIDIDIWEEDIIVFPKFDGVSCVFECDKDGSLQKALTRGDTMRNKCQDITFLFKNKGIVKSGKKDYTNQNFFGPDKTSETEYGLKTELMMFEEDLERFNTDFKTNYKNTRSAVSAITNNRDAEKIDFRKVWNIYKTSYLHVVPLRMAYMTADGEGEQVLAPGVYNYPYLNCKLKDKEEIHKFAFENKYVLLPKYSRHLRCDGCVIQLTNPKLQKALGRHDDKMKYEVAFKYTEETSYSKVVDIKFTAGLFGVMTPICYIEPVDMKGNTITKASLGSYHRFDTLKLRKGDIVKVLYDIIPYVDFDPDDRRCVRCENSPTILPPEVCPDCGGELSLGEGNILKCKNDGCPCRRKGKILNYLTKRGIADISYKTIDDFYEAGYLKKIEDLYTLKDKKSELENLEGYGKKSVKKIIDQIESKKTIKQSELLGAIGIEGVSVKTFHKILQDIPYDQVKKLAFDADAKAFMRVRGVKLKIGNKIVKGIRANKDLIKFLEKELNVVKEDLDGTAKFTVVFTRVRDEELENFIAENGGKVEDVLRKWTTVLCVPSLGIESKKVERALKYDVPMVTVDQLKDYITKNCLKN